MPFEVIMPKVDMDMASGKVIAWHAAPGDVVEKGAPLFDIETDKAAMEVEAPASGVLAHPVDEGTVALIGQPVAWIYAQGETVGDRPASAAPPAPAPHAPADACAPQPVPAHASQTPPAPDNRVRATPLARALARAGGLDLGGVAGSGARGRIQAGDLRDRLRAPADAGACARPAAGFAPDTGPLAITRSRSGGDGVGDGAPVVLLHGFASDSTIWAPLEPHLKHRPIIRIDLPGHGRSPKLRIRDFAALAATIRDAFDGLRLQKAHLIGHSLGGALALALADTRPRAVASLTLIAPAGLGPDINGAALDGITRAAGVESLGPWLRTLVADERLITDAYARAAMASRADPALRAAQRALAEALFPDGTQAFSLIAALARLDMPARIVWGRRDPVIPWRHALGAPGRAALHLFERVGHMPQIEIPEEVGNMLRQHL